MRGFLKKISAIGIGLLIAFLLLEIVFRFFVRASETPENCYDESHHLLHFMPNQQGYTTFGASAVMPTRWHINAAGWNSDIEYDSTDTRPLIAVIGDSYIESIATDIDKSYPALLQRKLSKQYRVYAFGVSSAPMSQYLNMCRFVCEKYKPNILIFNIVHNDFLESLSPYTYPDRGFMALDTATLQERYLPFHKFSKATQLLRKSKTVCYLMRNLKINVSLKNRTAFKKVWLNIGDTLLQKKIAIATDTILARIGWVAPQTEKVFVMDALRREIEQNDFDHSQIAWLNVMMKQMVEKKKWKFLDLTNSLLMDYKKNKKPFNSKIDPHWNEYGHQKVFEAVYDFLTKEGIIK